MAETLFIRLAGGETAHWATFDANGALAGSVSRGSLASATAAAHGKRCCVLLPGVDVTTALVDLPAASQARLRQILPFSLEESLADDVEHLAFAIGARRAVGGTPVAVASKQLVDSWLGRLREAGIAPAALCSEADGVPDVPGTLVLLVESNRIYGRLAESAPFVLEGLTLRQALDLVRSPGGEAERPHLLIYTEAADSEHVRREVAALGDEFASVEIKVAASGVFPHLAATLAQRAGTNLLQGAYAPRSNWVALLQPWRFAAGLGVATLVLSLLALGTQYWQLRRADQELNELVASTCQRVVGDARLSACQREVQKRVSTSAAGAGGDEFLSTLAAVSAARDSAMHIDALSYRNSILDLQLLAASVPALDEFARALEQTKRFDAEIQAANQKDNAIEGRVRVVGVKQ
ncbi:MAG: type II secretion system protein GspL [Gammaproteobacteria bacterium]